MSKNLNTMVLVGRVGGEPEIRVFENGTVLAKISLAVNRRGKDVPPDWFYVDFWGNPAKIVGDYVHKGDRIGVKGTLKIDRWKDKNGNDRKRPYILANNIELLGSKRESTPTNNNTISRKTNSSSRSGFKVPAHF